MRLGVSAECRGGRSHHRHCRSDSPAVPGLPLLHDGLPVPCAVFQLVGSAMAEGNGSSSQSGCCPPYARRCRKVQLLPRASPLCTDKGSCPGKRTIAAGTTFPHASRAVRPGPLSSGILRTSPARSAGSAGARKPFQFLPKLGTAPKLFYTSAKEWVRNMAGQAPTT